VGGGGALARGRPAPRLAPPPPRLGIPRRVAPLEVAAGRQEARPPAPAIAPVAPKSAPPAAAVAPAEPVKPTEPVVAQTPDAAPAPAAPASPAPVAERTDPKPDREAQELCELFFAADAFERRLILTSLPYLPHTPPKLPATLQHTDAWKLESAALQHKTDAVVHELKRMLGVSHKQARRIVTDEMGEPIVVAAKALELPAE